MGIDLRAMRSRSGVMKRWSGLCGILLVSMMCIAQQSTPAPQANPLAEISSALRAKQFTLALQRCKEALRRTPQDPRVWTLEAMSYTGLHRPAEALASFQSALHVAPHYLPALEGAAQLGYATHNPETEGFLHQLIQLRPDDPVAHAMLGELFFDKGDCAGATANFAKASEVIAQRPEVLLQYSSCLVKLSHFAEASEVFKQLLELKPNDEEVRYDLALAQFRAGHAAEAQATLAPILAAAEPGEDDLTLGADIAESQKDTQAALSLLRKAILLHPHDQSAYLDFVNLAYMHASMQVGLDVVNIGIKENPKAAELYFARGVLLCQLGKVDEGYADFNHADEIDPRLSFIGVAEGIAQSQAHNSAAALARFRAQVKQHPDDALAWYLLAEGLSQQGYPKGTAGFAETLHAAKRAVQLNPKSVDAADLVASLYLQVNDIQAAITASRAALAIDPENPQALYHLILAVRKTDQRTELPELVKRLMQARQLAAAKTEKSRPRTLVESPPPSPQGAADQR